MTTTEQHTGSNSSDLSCPGGNPAPSCEAEGGLAASTAEQGSSLLLETNRATDGREEEPLREGWEVVNAHTQLEEDGYVVVVPP